MEQGSGLRNNSSSGSGITFIDPSSLEGGVRKDPNVFILSEDTLTAIDNIPIGTAAGTMVLNLPSIGTWGIAGSNQAEYLDVSGGALPQQNVEEGATYIINVGGTIVDGEDSIVLVEGDKIQALISSPTQGITNGEFDDWVLVPAPTVSASSVSRSNGDTIETAFTKITHYEFGLQAPQSDFTINHNRNAYISSIKFSTNGDNTWDGTISNYNESDLNNVSFSVGKTLESGAKIKIQFNL